MYERAADATEPLRPLWLVEAARTLFVGPLTYNAPHQHGAAVYLAGVYGPFQLRLGGGPWLTCRTALIPAGVLHELDVGGEPIAVLYLEPSLGGAQTLGVLIADAEERGGALVGRAGEIGLLRELYEDPASVGWASQALTDLTASAAPRAWRALDLRIARAAARLERAGDKTASLTRIAAGAGLSASRFQHVFTAEVGVPFRRYRAWARMRRAIGEIVAGGSFTAAAHAAGFADQPHFAHDFRRTFGAPASVSLTRVRT